MDENKNRIWNALKIYYGIADSLEFSDENCTQTVCYANNYGLGYLYTVIPPNYKIHKKRKCFIKKIFGR